GEVQVVPSGFHGVAVECGARVEPALDRPSIQRLDADLIGAKDAAQAVCCEWRVAEVLAADLGRHMDALEHIGPAFSDPQQARDRHLGIDRLHLRPAVYAVCPKNEVAELTHAGCVLIPLMAAAARLPT